MTMDKILKLQLDDSDAAHKLYKSKGGEYGFTGPFYSPGPERAIDDDLWSKCMEAVTGCKTLTDRVVRYQRQ